MSIERIVMCDGCGAIATPALESEDPRALAEAEGWLCDADSDDDYCPSCRHKGDLDYNSPEKK